MSLPPAGTFADDEPSPASVCLPESGAPALVLDGGRLQARAPGLAESIWEADGKSAGLLVCGPDRALVALVEGARTQLVEFGRASGSWELLHEARVRGVVIDMAHHDGRFVLEVRRGSERELRVMSADLERVEAKRRLASGSDCLTASGPLDLLFSGTGARVRTFRLPSLDTWLVFEFDAPVTACAAADRSGLLAVATASSLEVVDPRSEAFRGRLTPIAASGDDVSPVGEIEVVTSDLDLRTHLTVTGASEESLRIVDLAPAGTISLSPSSVVYWRAPGAPPPSPPPAPVASEAPAPVPSEQEFATPATESPTVPDEPAATGEELVEESAAEQTTEEMPVVAGAVETEEPVQERSDSEEIAEPIVVEEPAPERSAPEETAEPIAAEAPSPEPSEKELATTATELPPPPAAPPSTAESEPSPFSARIVLKGRADLVAEVVLLGPDSILSEHSRTSISDLPRGVFIDRRDLPPGRYRVQLVGKGGATLDVRPPFATIVASEAPGEVITFEIAGTVDR